MIMVILFILGLAIGSFVSASVWRLHEQEKLRSAKKKSNKNLSITKGRSMCEHCSHKLSTKDLIPVISWVGLRGKCRYCHEKLSWEYPVVEITTAILFALSFYAWSFEPRGSYFSFGFWLIFLSTLIFLAIYDIKWKLLPSKIIDPLSIAVFAYLFVMSIFFGGGLELLKTSAVGIVIIAGFFELLYRISASEWVTKLRNKNNKSTAKEFEANDPSGDWIGGGDINLGIPLGAYLGASLSLLTLAGSFYIAAFITIPLMLLNKLSRKSQVPFGPFLVVAAVISVLYGHQIIQWYSDTFLYGLF